MIDTNPIFSITIYAPTKVRVTIMLEIRSIEKSWMKGKQHIEKLTENKEN